MDFGSGFQIKVCTDGSLAISNKFQNLQRSCGEPQQGGLIGMRLGASSEQMTLEVIHRVWLPTKELS
jgi:hypothetical protein